MPVSRPVTPIGVRRAAAALTLLAVFVASTEPSNFPDQPSSFDSGRDDTNAQWATSFSQNECRDKLAFDNVGHETGLDLEIDYTYANCVNDTGGFNVARNGLSFPGNSAAVQKYGNTMAISDGAIGSSFVSKFSGSGAFTLEMWIQMDTGGWGSSPASKETVTFFEISRLAQGYVAFGSGTKDSMRFTYVRSQFSPKYYLWFQETANTGTAFEYGFNDPHELEDADAGIYYLVLTRGDGEASPTIYFNKTTDGPLTDTFKGWDMNDEIPPGDASSTTAVTAAAWKTDNYIRVGCTREDFNDPPSNVPYSVLFAALHNDKFTPQQYVDHFNAGVPNNIPVAATGGSGLKINVDEDQLAFVDLVDTNVLKDVDGDALQYVIVSVPTGPFGLYDSDNPTVKLTAPHHISDPSKLRFKADAAHFFTPSADCTAGNGDAVVGTQIAAIDGVCSAGSGVTDASCRSEVVDVIICVDDVNDPPIISAVPDRNVQLGSDDSFSLTAFVSDTDLCGPAIGCGNLNNGATVAQIEFHNVSLTFGDLYDKCTSGRVKLDADTPYDVTSSFCYVSKDSGDLPPLTSTDPLGEEIFYFEAFDTEGLASETLGTITFNILTPLEVCTSSCHLAGVTEGHAGATFVLPQVNQLGNTDHVIEIITPPAHGALYKTSVAPSNELGAGDTLDALDYTVLYVPDPDYFNVVTIRSPITGLTPSGSPVPSPPTANLYTSLDKTNGYYDCADLTNGCPDEFEYGLVITATQTRSLPATATVEVISEPSDSGHALKAPDGIWYDETLKKRYVFTEANNKSDIVYTDPDGDAYFVGIDIFADTGTLSLSGSAFLSSDDNIEQGQANSLSCLNLNSECKRFQFVGYPSAINTLLSKLEYFSLDKVNPVTQRVTIGIYKGKVAPNGIGFNDFDGDPVVEKQIVLNNAGTTADPSKGFSTQFIVIVASISALAFILSINGLIYLGNKSKKAAAAARQSLRRLSRGSRSQSTTGDVDVKAVGGPSRTLFILAFFFPCIRCIAPKRFEKTYVASKSIGGKKGTTPSSSTALAAAGPTPILSSTDSASAAAPQNKRGSVAAQKTAVMEVADDSIFDWEKHIDKATGDVYFFNPKTGVSQWDPPTVQAKRAKK